MNEEHNKSHLYQYLWGYDGWLTAQRNWNTPKDFYKKIDYSVILNSSLTIADKAVYLAILYHISYTKNYKTQISSNQIESISGIIQQNQTRSIKKLKDARIIDVYGSRYENRFTITKEPKTFLAIKLEQFKSLKHKRKEFVRRLTGIVLSSGNERIPEYKTCLIKMGKLTKKEFQKIKTTYYDCACDEPDIDNYKRL